MRKILMAIFVSLISGSGIAMAAQSWELVWSDEFEYTGKPDSTKWRIQVGPSTVNGEAEYYSDRLENLKVENGNLYIIARKEAMGGKSYTSGRLDTETKAWWTYGRIEIKAKVPGGKGSWPAFWTLGHDCTAHGGWPDCGEIDIAEYAGKNPDYMNCTMHMKDINYKLKNNPHGGGALKDVSGTFHVYALEWYADRLDVFYDSVKVLTFPNANKGAGSWPYFNPQYIILNEALGGGYGGPIDNSIFPTQWVIDYVRVFRASTVPVSITGSPSRPQTQAELGPETIRGFRFDLQGRKVALKNAPSGTPYLLAK